jgi:hypothetical protein
MKQKPKVREPLKVTDHRSGNWGSHDGMAGNMASGSYNYEAQKYRELNRQQPVKVYTKEEIAEYQRKRQSK